MAFTPQPGEQYTLRRKIFSFLGASFHVYDDTGSVVAFCRQKALKLREDIRLYTDESKTEELLTMKTRSVIDFGATYDIALPGGEIIGSLRRKGLRSFVRDSWLIYGPEGEELATLEEDSSMLAILRRVHEVFALFSPQKFEVVARDGQHIATLRSHFNPFVFRLGIAIHADHAELDERIVIAAGCLIAAIEGRQG